MRYLQQQNISLRAYCQRSVATVLMFNLLLQSCQSRLNTLEESSLDTAAILESDMPELSSRALSTPTTSSPYALQHSTLRDIAIPEDKEVLHQQVITDQTVPEARQVLSKVFTTSSGEKVKFVHENGQWQATPHSPYGAYTTQRVFPVISPKTIGRQLSWLQRQDIWTSKARIHILPASIPPYTSYVYLGRSGLLGGGRQESSERSKRTRKDSRGGNREIIRVVPSLASLCIESLLNACRNEDHRERNAWALIEATKVAPEHTLHRLLAAYKDRARIRGIVIRAFVETAKIIPEHTLDHLFAAFEGTGTQQAAANILKNMSMEIPELLLNPLRAAYQHENQFVRQATIKTLGNVAKVAPELASTCLESVMLATSKDGNDLVRNSAFGVLLDVAKAVPEQALPFLLAVDEDESWYARYAVVMALLEVAQVAPEHAASCLSPLKNACHDEHPGVSQAAIYALRELKKIKVVDRGIL